MDLLEAMLKVTADIGKPPAEINRGDCYAWADNVARIIPACDVWAENQEGENNLPGHYFIKYGVLFYDSECLTGTADYHNLPIFKRSVTHA